MEKLFSIVMPTRNRLEVLRYTLSLLKEQVIRNKDRVELIICNNASTDGTKEYLEDLLARDSFFKFVNYADSVDIGVSITRSIENATGKYFLLWSDDDIPGPYMVDILLDSLMRHPDVECITFNRIQGYAGQTDKLFKKCRLLNQEYPELETVYDSSEKFILERWRGMTFLSADLVSIEAWKRGLPVYSKEHFGWEFLTPILYGISGKKCLFINYPMCIQRWLYKPTYRIKWPSYIYVGIPRMLKCLEEKGVIHGWRKTYDNYLSKGQFNSSTIGYLFDILYWASQNLSHYRPLIKEMSSVQPSYIKKCITYLLYLPEFVHKFNRRIIKSFFKLVGKEKSI